MRYEKGIPDARYRWPVEARGASVASSGSDAQPRPWPLGLGPRYNAECMGQRSTLRNSIEYCAALAAVKSLEWAPVGAAHWLARRYTGLLDLAIPRLRRVAYGNLAMALPGANHRQIVDGVFRSIARILVTVATGTAEAVCSHSRRM